MVSAVFAGGLEATAPHQSAEKLTSCRLTAQRVESEVFSPTGVGGEHVWQVVSDAEGDLLAERLDLIDLIESGDGVFEAVDRRSALELMDNTSLTPGSDEHVMPRSSVGEDVVERGH